jgi:hypothetical protein
LRNGSYYWLAGGGKPIELIFFKSSSVSFGLKLKIETGSIRLMSDAYKKSFDLEAIPQPWTYNPSRLSQRVPICIVASFAVIIAVYLGLYEWKLIDHIWDPVFGTDSEKVLNSNVSHWITYWIGIPDATLGAISYLGDIIFALAGSTRRWQDRPWLVILFGLDVIPISAVSVTLVALQGTVVGYWCFLCLTSAFISLILIILAYDEVWSCFLFISRVWKKTKDPKLLWNTFWGRPSIVAHEIGLELIKERTNKKKKTQG